MHIRYLSLILSILCFISIHVSQMDAQQVIVNSKGEKIVIFPDGSWRHFEPADTMLIRPNLRSDSPFNQSQNAPLEAENPVDPTMGKSSEKRKAIEFANQLRYEADQARTILVEATNDKFNVEAKLNQAIENPNLIEVDIRAKLEEDYAKATLEVKNAKQYHKQLSKFAEKALDIPDMEGTKREKSLSKLMAKHSAYLASTEWKPNSFREQETISLANPRTQETKPQSKLEKTDPKTSKQIPPIKGENRKKDVKRIRKTFAADTKWSVPVNRPYAREQYECYMQVDQVDPVTKQRRLVVEQSQLFTHTDEELRPYFRDENLLECVAFLSSVEGFKYLTVKFIIASPNAKHNFGMLQQQALLRIKLINGTFLNFYNIRADRGEIDQYTGNTIFTGNYSLGKSAEKELLSSEVDKMRVVWSTGYEDYDIHEVDFFMNQINCLNKY